MNPLKIFVTKLCLSTFLVFTAVFASAQETAVKVTAIRSAKGKVMISAFKDKESFDKEIPFKTFTFDKKGLVNGTLDVTIQLDAGTYGLTMVDDENNNGKIDKNFIGIPKEGFGFSNFFMEKLKKPAFDQFKVDIKPAAPKITIKVKYL